MSDDNKNSRIGAAGSMRAGGRRTTSRRGGVGIWLGLLISLLLLGTIASASFGWWAWQEWARIDARLGQQHKRIASIEQLMSITSEDLSESGKRIGERVEKLFSEVSKLWVSAQRNQAEVAELREGADARGVLLAEQTRTLSEAAALAETLRQRLETLDPLVAALNETQVTPEVVTEMRELLDDALERIGANAAWLEGINEWRGEYNQRLLDLRSAFETLAQPPEEEEEVLRWQEVEEE